MSVVQGSHHETRPHLPSPSLLGPHPFVKPLTVWAPGREGEVEGGGQGKEEKGVRRRGGEGRGGERGRRRGVEGKEEEEG